MTIFPGGRKTHAQLERLERSVQDQIRALGDQQSTLGTLGDRLTQLERQLAGIGSQLQATLNEAREHKSASEADVEVSGSLKKMRTSLKGLRQSDKRMTQDFGRLLERLAKVSVSFDASIDARFVDVARPLVKNRRTMLGFDRLFTLWQAAGNVAHLNLPAVEVGTFLGGSAALIAEAFRTLGGERELHVVDTFEGHLDHTLTDHDPEEQRGKFRTANYEEVRQYLAAFAGVHVHKGDAASVISGWPERRYALVHIDVDLYRPMLECLDYFGARVAAGGVMVIDDYEAPTCPGVSVAAHEYLARMPHFQTWKLQAEQLVLVKR